MQIVVAVHTLGNRVNERECKGGQVNDLIVFGARESVSLQLTPMNMENAWWPDVET